MYNIPWYLLPLSSQKDVIHIIRRLQDGAVLRMGPLAEINFELASNVSSLIVSVYFIINFIVSVDEDDLQIHKLFGCDGRLRSQITCYIKTNHNSILFTVNYG